MGTRLARCDNGDSLGDYVGKQNERRQKMLDVKARVAVGMVSEGRAALCEVVLRGRHATDELGEEGSTRALGFLR